MMTCKECDVSVHRECYGMPTYMKNSFTCWACQAVGGLFQVDGRLKNGKRLEITQVERPMHCDLCSINDGFHAMHPIYDTDGRTGRQIFLIDQFGPRLAWAHSLCAFVLSSKGFLYGCDPGGDFFQDSDDDEEDEDDDGSLNPELTARNTNHDDYEDDTKPVHHFVYYKKRKGKEHNVWTKAIELQQHGVTCTICGKSDKPEQILRIPIQCCANDPDEYKEFKKKHETGEPCTVGLHVGCARWGGMNKNNVQRVYFFPGNADMDEVKGVLCTLHGEDLDTKCIKKKERAAAAQNATNIAMQIDMLATDTKLAPAPAKKVKKIRELDMSVLPSLAKKIPMKKSRIKPSKPKAAAKTLPAVSVVLKPAERKQKWFDKLNKASAVSVSQVERPLLKRHRKELASEKSIVTKSTVNRLSEDLIQHTKHLEIKQRKQVLVERKKFWKRQLSELTTEDFKSLWTEGKAILADAILHEDNDADGNGKPSASKKQVSASVAQPLQAAAVQENLHTLITGKSSKRPPPRPKMVDLTADSDASHNGDQLEAAKKDDAVVRKNNQSEELAGVSDSKKMRSEDLARASDSISPDSNPTPEGQTIQEMEADDDWLDGPSSDPTDEEEDIETPNRWSYLCIGPNFRNEQYKFGEWDSMEIVL